MKACRTCLKVLQNDASFLAVDSEDYDIHLPSIRSKLLTCVPELALDVVRCAVICSSCSDALNTAYAFKSKCLQTEEKIINYTQLSGSNLTDFVDIIDIAHHDDDLESKQITDAHYPLTQIIENDDEIDVKPVLIGDDSNEQSAHFLHPQVTIKECSDLEQSSDSTFPVQLPFSPEFDVEVKGSNFLMRQNQTFQVNGDANNLNRFICTYCQKTFAFLMELESHLMTHAETRPYKCTMCDRRFVRKDKLMLHTRIHTGEKPFQCTLCGRSFSRKDKMNNHMRTHTGEKPHQCILCQKSFARKDKMNTHMRSQHWLALANLEITVVKNETNITQTNLTETNSQ